MPAISDTSPLFYLHRIGRIEWLPRIFDEVWVPVAVAEELAAGRLGGFDAPDPKDYPWISIREVDISTRSTPSADLGAGESAAIFLARQRPDLTLLLDDGLARAFAQGEGLEVWGTLRIVLEAKSRGWIPSVAPLIDELRSSGMWIGPQIRGRILHLAGESPS